MELKIGDVVYLNSEPNVKMTVVYIENGYIQAVFYSSLNNKFDYSVKLPIKAVTKVS